MMHHQVIVNGRALGRQISGVERYAREVTSRLAGSFQLAGISAPQGIPGHMWEQWALPWYVKEQQILWSPANSGPLTVSNQVLTLHDVSVIDHPEWFDAKYSLWYRWLLPRLVRRVKIILTTSRYSRIRIQQVFRICENNIRLAPGGVDLKVFHPRGIAEQEWVRRKYSLPEAYILFVGTLEPRKNLRRLYHAWRYVYPRIPHLQLVIAGAQARQFRNSRTAGEPTADGIIWKGRVDDADLPALYSGALLFVFPSIYEGFGLPPLEAMACGTPVIAGDATSLPEVTGDAAYLVPPHCEDCIAAAILELAGNETRRKHLIDRGLKRAQAFPWERTARLVEEAIEAAGA